MKKCPYCAEEIQDDAIACRYCGRDLEGESSLSPHGNNAPIYEYSAKGHIFSLVIYRNRISILDRRGGISSALAQKRTDIMLKNITGVNIKGILRNLELTMNDGTLRKIPLIYGRDSEKARDVLVELI